MPWHRSAQSVSPETDWQQNEVQRKNKTTFSLDPTRISPLPLPWPIRLSRHHNHHHNQVSALCVSSVLALYRHGTLGMGTFLPVAKPSGPAEVNCRNLLFFRNEWTDSNSQDKGGSMCSLRPKLLAAAGLLGPYLVKSCFRPQDGISPFREKEESLYFTKWRQTV